MATGRGGNENRLRNQRVAFEGLATQFGTVTTTAEAGTLNDFCGIVTTNALDAAQNANETIVITNNKVAAGDVCIAQLIGGTTAGTPLLLSAVCTANTITFVVKNAHASAVAFNGTVIIGFVVIKALSGGV